MKPNSYSEWRMRSGLAPVLREEQPIPPERLLQVIWFHQRISRDQLTTLDGKRVRVLHPGFWNHEAGPDFRSAVIQFDDETPRSCDLEIDLHTNGWRAHRHDQNPDFKNVALHVVWEGDSATALPTLALKDLLDSPLSELSLWLGSDAAQSFPKALTGQCCAPLDDLAPEQLGELLRQAALVRLQSKAVRLQARARLAGWEQALWEGLFRALGYKQNVWPMQRLAELRDRWSPPKIRFAPFVLQARLLGISGLLPRELTRVRASSDDYLRRVWDYWWRERESFSDCAMPASLWRFNGLRPANHPQRRLALAARWLAAGGFIGGLQHWCAAEVTEANLVESLLETLQVTEDEFWSWHWTLRSRRFPKAQPLLGVTRATDLAVNVILPWLWIRAVEGKNVALQEEMERRYFAWPAAQDNAVLRLARQRLFGSGSKRALDSAAAQQGLLQIVRDYCEHSNALCANCQFPALARQWHA